jgi:hypothetical protein
VRLPSDKRSRLLIALSGSHGALGKLPATRRLLRATPLEAVGRTWLLNNVLRDELPRKQDITVVIGLRDRADYRLDNALKSIRSQTFPADLIRIILVDYGSNQASARIAMRSCEEYEAQYVRVDDISVWSRARCLNIGIRRTQTKFLMVSDVDVVFSPQYLSDAVQVLADSPLSVVSSAMMDLAEDSTEVLRIASITKHLPLDRLKASSHPRNGWTHHPGICMTYTMLYKIVNGYDEYYEAWGAEDEDLMRRFRYLGLRPTAPGARSYYLHQWHPERERGREEATTQRNQSYLARTHSILRNDLDWGTAPHSAPCADVSAV